MSSASRFGYRIRRTEDGWAWATLAPDGQIQQQGDAPSRAVAAAFVIRALACPAAPMQRAA